MHIGSIIEILFECIFFYKAIHMGTYNQNKCDDIWNKKKINKIHDSNKILKIIDCVKICTTSSIEVNFITSKCYFKELYLSTDYKIK